MVKAAGTPGPLQGIAKKALEIVQTLERRREATALLFPDSCENTGHGRAMPPPGIVPPPGLIDFIVEQSDITANDKDWLNECLGNYEIEKDERHKAFRVTPLDLNGDGLQDYYVLKSGGGGCLGGYPHWLVTSHMRNGKLGYRLVYDEEFKYSVDVLKAKTNGYHDLSKSSYSIPFASTTTIILKFDGKKYVAAECFIQ
jgi:hypothetical protein